jgi:LysM repeat protein
MKTISPFVPQGATLPRGKSNIYFKVLLILTIHVVVIGGMLLQGCRDIPKDRASDGNATNASETALDTTTNSNPVAVPPLSSTALSNNPMAPGLPASQPLTPSQPPQMIPPPPAVAATAPAPSSEEYVIAAGDTLRVIAKRQHVSLEALKAANPGVNPRKLHIGQKLVMPAAATVSGAGKSAETVAADDSVYVVKSGDSLVNIARQHGTSYKKLMVLNDLKSTAIHVGQKLKVPAPKSAAPEATPGSSPAVQPQAAPLSTAPASSSAPMSVAN